MDDTRRNDIGATVFAILLGLSALFFTGWLFTAGGCSDQSADHEVIEDVATVDPIAGDDADAIDADAAAVLKADYDAEIEAEAARRAELAEENRLLKEELEGTTPNSEVQARINTLEAEVKTLKANEAKLDTALDNNKTIKANLVKAESDLALATQQGKDWEGKLNLATASEGTLKADLAALTGRFAAATKTETDLKAQLATSLEKAKDVDMAKSEAGKLRSRVTDLEKKLNDVSKEKLALENKAKAMSAGSGDAAKKMQADLDAMKKKAADDAKAAADKLAATEKKLADAAKAMTANAGDDAKKLQAQLDGMKKKADADTKAAADKLAAAEKKLADANKTMTAGSDEAAKKLQAELAAAKKKADADSAAWGTAKTKMSNEIEALKKQLAAKAAAMPAAAALAPAAEGLPELDLPLLINNPAKLNENFKDLFVNLRGIEDSPAAREAAYTKLTGDGKYEPSLSIPFSSGSDFIAAEDKKKIEALVKEAGADAKFLAVGYASTDGSNETNYRLSSQRASKVGQEIAADLGKSENVQAIYFGQTGRFSSKKGPNRIVEIWRVK